MDKLIQTVQAFGKDEEGAQVIEYALIIAVVSITLVVALRDLTGSNFADFITRVGTCLTNGSACA
ncbi:Flp family type IVb pilin [Ramlibacter algicola]|uniref:Flp family type IVb pilin n=1 Tax=Ramlibacter algicola TaxID=2795217 RepID=A0A934Q3R9_9BURK|nr:Flp family type IVb pilin [Ramlibacter algicola]MBK0394007.1 Flp family type IVb pilin [Ramlibacter algicola]